MSPIHLYLKLLALSIALTPFTGLCAKRTGAVGHRQLLLLPRGSLFWLTLSQGWTFVSPLFSQDMGFGRLIHRCHRYLKDLISEALPGISTSVINNTLGFSFGLRCQVAVGTHLVPVNPTNVWSIYVSFLEGKKNRSSIWFSDVSCCRDLMRFACFCLVLSFCL